MKNLSSLFLILFIIFSSPFSTETSAAIVCSSQCSGLVNEINELRENITNYQNGIAYYQNLIVINPEDTAYYQQQINILQEYINTATAALIILVTRHDNDCISPIACDDDNNCTINDQCNEGRCVGIPVLSCTQP